MNDNEPTSSKLVTQPSVVNTRDFMELHFALPEPESYTCPLCEDCVPYSCTSKTKHMLTRHMRNKHKNKEPLEV